jgi:hypothetical protein
MHEFVSSEASTTRLIIHCLASSVFDSVVICRLRKKGQIKHALLCVRVITISKISHIDMELARF